MAEDQAQPGQGQAADPGAASKPPSESAAPPAPDRAADAGRAADGGHAADVAPLAAMPPSEPAFPAVATDAVPGWYPRAGFRNLTGYEPVEDETNGDADVTRWYTSSEGGLSTGAINPPGLGAQIGYADFSARFGAAALDAIVIYLLTYVSLFSGLGVVAIPIVLLGYFPFFWIKFGATPGMRVCGLNSSRGRRRSDRVQRRPHPLPGLLPGNRDDRRGFRLRCGGLREAKTRIARPGCGDDRGSGADYDRLTRRRRGAGTWRFDALMAVVRALPVGPLGPLEQTVLERPFCGKLGGRLGGETPFPAGRGPPSMHPACRG